MAHIDLFTGNADTVTAMLTRLAALLFGFTAYLLFLVVFVLLILFLGGFGVGRGINEGDEVSLGEALAVNLGLLFLFGLQHSGMARQWFKDMITRFIPEATERSGYVLAASLSLALLVWQWRPMPAVIWQIDWEPAVWLIRVIYFGGWLVVLYTTHLIRHFDLFGLRQVILHFRQRPYHVPNFQSAFLYRLVRHPFMLGFLMGFWSTPQMTVGHLLFAVVTTLYIVIGTRLEEQDLIRRYGESYRQYQQATPMLVPGLKVWRRSESSRS